MELAFRKGSDAFVPPGAYRALEARLRQHASQLAETPAVVLSCFDPSTRLLPFVLYDSMIFPAGARSIAGSLYQAGFSRIRAVFQLWNPNFRASQARLDGRPPQLLLLSSMQMHAQRAYDAIRDAWSLGDDRPLIVAGGPKAIYEPYHFWPLPSRHGPIGPDVVVTGESYVLLDLLNVLVQFRGNGDTMRTAFDRARRAGALERVPGLVYLAADATMREPVLVDTGLQRLVQDLDELPHEVTGLGLMEPPHRGVGLSPRPIQAGKVRKHARIVSLQVTQGCKFNCPYCPIPAYNQKTWRYRSPEGLAHEITSVNERFGIRYYFGADDNFFNRRETAEELLTSLARARTTGRPLGEKIRLATEATQFDTYKNRDLLPLAKAAGVHAIWFGIEDLTAELINKGQKPEVTLELFRLLHQHQISPMAMIMYHDGQPFHSPGSLYGLANQVAFLRQAGAISLQCTVHTPAVGTREYEKTYESGRVFQKLGSFTVSQSRIDGNHVIVAGSETPWKRQLKQLAAYATFYNPWNTIRATRKDSPLWKKRFTYQIVGQIATIWTALKMVPYLFRLMFGKPRYHAAPPPQATVPVRVAQTAFPRLPSRPTMSTSESLSGAA